MQIVIDIPEELYDWIEHTGVLDHKDCGYIGGAILDGTVILDNATNGDVIKALFPDIEIADILCLDKVYTGIPFGKYIGANIDCMREWWNAPYKAGDIE